MKNLRPQDNNSELPLQVVTQKQISYKGPLPPPQHFAGYEEVLPGAGERIFKMAENHSELEISETRLASKRDFIVTILVISGTFLFAFFGLGIGVYLLIIGKIGVAIGTMFGSVIFLLATLLRSFFKNPEK